MEGQEEALWQRTRSYSKSAKRSEARRHRKPKKRKTDYELTAIGGNRYPSLEAAQEAARETMVQGLVAAIGEGLLRGVLVVSNGKVVFADEEDGELAHGA